MSVGGWWAEMFELPAWQAVQLGWESLEDADHQVDLIVRATGLHPGMRALDVPCGTGRIAKRLRQSDNWRREFGASQYVRHAASVRVLNHHKNSP